MKRLLVGLACLAAFVTGEEQARAALLEYTSRATFEALGQVVYDSNFNDFGSGFSYPGDPFTRGGVTYTSTDNLIVGQGTGFHPVVNLIANNYWTPVQGSIESSSEQFDMFGFDIGVLNVQDRQRFTLTTNLGSYTLPFEVIADGSVYGTRSLDFRGFVATGSDEYFTNFRVDTESGSGQGLPGLTDVTLGHASVSSVPEPASLTLLCVGLAGLCGYGWRRRKATQPV